MKNIPVIFFAQRVHRIIRSLISLATLLCLSVSCDDFVEVPLPSSQLTRVTVFEDRLTANAAMAQVYVQLRDSGILTGLSTGASYNMGLYADEMQDYTTSAITLPIYNNTLTVENLSVASLWRISYNQIYITNAIIAGVANSTSLTTANKDQLRGEALFVRALIHFYLLNIYGDIPYVTTTVYDINRHVSRQSSEVVYKAIVADLEEAVLLLPENYVTPDRVRPNKMTANALLARVYLYMGLNSEAANTASAVLNSSLYSWGTDLNKVFLRASTTTIWQFAAATSLRNTNEGAIFIFVSGPPPSIALRMDFINSFEPGDQRRVHWIKAVTKGTNTWYHAYKYKLRTATASSQEYSIVFRLAEQYLIRAEARAKQGELIGAKEDLNKIRTTAGLAATSAVTSAEILSDILQQRKFELFTEYGHRFFDLKRSGTVDTALSLAKPGWNHTDALWPIPETELSANPNLLPQNPGY